MGILIDSTTAEFLIASLLIFWLTYLYFVKDYGYWEDRNVPHVPPEFPFGSIKRHILGCSYLGDSFDGIYKHFKDERFVGIFMIRNPAVLVRDPELVRMVLQKDFYHFTDHYSFKTNPKDYLMNHLYALKGQEWKAMRMKLSPAYTAVKIKTMFFLVKECSYILREVVGKLIDQSNALDVKDVLSRFTTDVIASCAFGIESNSLSNKESKFYQLGLKSMNRDFLMLLKLFLYISFPVFEKYHCFNFMDRSIVEFFTAAVRSTVEYREKNNVSRLDFLDLLIKLRQNQSILEEGERLPDFSGSSRSEIKEGLTIEEITAETYLFFTAGFETTSNTTMFCLYELACNGRIQDQLYWEVEDVLDRHEGNISYQALQEMTYLDQVINETLRRYPPFPYLSRCCSKDYVVPDSTLTIKKGQEVIIPMYSFHHDSKYFPDPYSFDPERFSPKKHKTWHPYAYLPFGEGPRMCIGQKFGLMNVKTALATLVADYQISLTPETEVPLKLKNDSFTTVPSTPLLLIFTRRKENVNAT
ncbi:probable cytochrome P450 6a14 isoform X1 [Homalodisca vitripennis]|uniref:probable cytochrome P450 6a14 isoform X1 n=1 Tax=Homalodisca vitripennis TaxID=197043 RepID=UPI001EEB3E56|nr:probable cytochrome P450 6a14 isoform X1 [Homalodisca vitripennis]XP_046679585.1 probable cytochrome P450 6a14 isoform X1 [Homalodisca vitripennis]